LGKDNRKESARTGFRDEPFPLVVSKLFLPCRVPPSVAYSVAYLHAAYLHPWRTPWRTSMPRTSSRGVLRGVPPRAYLPVALATLDPKSGPTQGDCSITLHCWRERWCAGLTTLADHFNCKPGGHGPTSLQPRRGKPTIHCHDGTFSTSHHSPSIRAFPGAGLQPCVHAECLARPVSETNANRRAPRDGSGPPSLYRAFWMETLGAPLLLIRPATARKMMVVYI
jgi:hypothetical protein